MSHQLPQQLQDSSYELWRPGPDACTAYRPQAFHYGTTVGVVMWYMRILPIRMHRQQCTPSGILKPAP